MFKNKETNKYHTAFLPMMITGILGLGALIGVILGELSEETLLIIIAPIITFLTMVRRNSKSGEN